METITISKEKFETLLEGFSRLDCGECPFLVQCEIDEIYTSCEGFIKHLLFDT